MVNVFQYTKFKVEGDDFTSSVIASLAYNVYTSEMLVQFKHGSQRLYKNVGPLTFTNFTKADSVGQHYNDVFKGNKGFPSEAANFDGFQKVVEEEPLADWERELLENDFDDRFENTEPVEAEVNLNRWTVGQEVSDDDYNELPVGSEVYAPAEQGGNLIKISDTHWEDNLTQYHSNLLFSDRELVKVGDGTYDNAESETSVDSDLEAAQPLWYNDSVRLYADGSANFSSITANEVTLGTVSTNHLFDVSFETGRHNDVIRGGAVPVWAADEAQALVKFQSAMTALGYETVRVKSVMHHF